MKFLTVWILIILLHWRSLARIPICRNQQRCLHSYSICSFVLELSHTADPDRTALFDQSDTDPHCQNQQRCLRRSSFVTYISSLTLLIRIRTLYGIGLHRIVVGMTSIIIYGMYETPWYYLVDNLLRVWIRISLLSMICVVRILIVVINVLYKVVFVFLFTSFVCYNISALPPLACYDVSTLIFYMYCHLYYYCDVVIRGN